MELTNRPARAGTAPVTNTDPLRYWNSKTRIKYTVAGQNYTRRDYQWHLKNTGQPSDLFYNGNLASSEPGGTYDMGVELAWTAQPHANDIPIGIVTSGCQTNQEDLAGVVKGGIQFNYRDSFDPNDISDSSYHGTAMASMIGALKDNGKGLCGVAPGAPLYVVKTHCMATSESIIEVANGIRWCVDKGCKIICLAMGTNTGTSDLSEACAYASNSGRILVCALPNSESDYDQNADYPTSYNLPLVLPITAVDRTCTHYAPSGWRHNAVGAPGRCVIGAHPAFGYAYYSGTSCATALTCGALALIWQRFPNQKASVVLRVLLDGCMNKGAAKLPLGAVHVAGSFSVLNIQMGASRDSQNNRVRID